MTRQQILDHSFVVVAVVWVLGSALSERPRALGDAGEYLLTAESLFNHGTADLRDEDRRSLLAAVREGKIGAIPAPLYRTYRPDRNGRAYALHFWAYPLSCLPLKAVLRLLGGNELKAFQLTNAVLFLAAVLRARRLGGPSSAAGWALSTLLLLSPATAFVLWPHPEAFSCALVVLGLVLWAEGRPRAAAASTAVASLQNAPLVLLAAFFAWEAARPGRARGSTQRAIAGPSLALLPALWPFAFYLYHYGTPTLLSALGLANASPRKTLELFFDLNLGMLPYVPLALLGAVAAPAVQVATGRPARVFLELWALLVAMAFACGLAGNWNHGTSGPSRYAIWMLPLVLVLFVRMLEPGVADDRARRAFGALALLALAAQAVIVAARGGLAPRPDYLRHSYLAAFVLERAPALYDPSPEIFVERTLGYEVLDGVIPNRAAVVYAPHGRCRKALCQKRHWPDLLARCGPAARAPDFKSLAAAHRRDTWVYVDY